MNEVVHHVGSVDDVQRINQQLEEIRALEHVNTGEYLLRMEELVTETVDVDLPRISHITVLSELGNAYRANGKFTEALSTLQRTIQYAAELQEDSERIAAQALASLRMAIVGELTGNLVLAFDYVDQAMQGFRAIDDAAGVARCNLVLGAAYLRLEDYAESEQACRAALAYYRQQNDFDRVAVALVNLTTVLLRQHRYQEAAATAREALPFARSPLLQAAVTGSLGNALSGLGELDEALALFESTWKALHDLGDPAHQVTYKRAVGTILSKRKQYPEAIAHLEKALEIATAYHLDGHATLCLGLLAQTHGEAGTFEQAYHYLREYHQRILDQKAETAKHQLDLHKWRMKVLAAEQRVEELEHSSYRDFLTQLANRRFFDLRLAEFVNDYGETGQDFGVLVLDLDRFKRVNDRHGHLTGDKVLQATALIMLETVRRTDVVARIGGEEFGIIVNGPLEREHLRAIAEKLRVAFLDYDWNPIVEGLKVTVSIGGALFSEITEDPIQVLDLADKRLYKAKGAGRNHVWTAQ